MTCKLCSSGIEPKPLYRGIVECAGCGLKYFPYSENTTDLYQENYFRGAEYQDYSSEKEMHQTNFRERLKMVRKIVPEGKLLELGCAYGFFLDLAKENFQVKGVDITMEGVENARKQFGVEAVCADFLTLPDETNSYDVICMWDTLEHLPEPFLYLQKASKWLKPGGRIFFSTLDSGSVVARVRGPKWRMIHPPTHLFYFDRPILARAVKEAGLRLESFHCVGQYRKFRAMAYEVFVLRMPRFRWLYQLITLGGRLDFSLYLNTFDIIQIRAQKPLEEKP
ncbi:MAG TPA: class I SAM-dependent methyltransferase [Bdellovibrionota bacterium]|jgi:2-polyprenyl-3-methyl-5-hydroxy-6-metoxy-1,4-benzoquinol methylase